MEWGIFILLAAFFVSYANGANDNFKGVATLLGSHTTNYKKAIGWATITTMAGSLTALFWAEKLIKTFSGKGLVPDELTTNPEFLLAVAAGASITILMATLTGIPISTTHSLMGALVGAGLIATNNKLELGALEKGFLFPLLCSPIISIILTAMIYPVFKFFRQRLGVDSNTCLCLREKIIPVPALLMANGHVVSTEELRGLDIYIDEKEACELKVTNRYTGQILGIDAQKILGLFHFLSAGAVSFARGLNDTPKIVAIAVAAGMLGIKINMVLVGVAMAVGGLLSAKKVARTVSFKITGMNHGQGFTANLITALLVILASRLGMPVSTTHVSCGTLFGLGLVNGQAHWKTIFGIVGAWVLTLPMAAIFSGGFYYLFQKIGL